MKRSALFHPRVFSDQEWAEGYYKRNAKSIKRVGKRLATLLRNSGFERGKILDAGCGFGAVAIELATEFPDAEIVGIDLGEPLLGLGQTLVRQAGLSNQITLLKGDVQKMDFRTDTFDMVVNTFMLHIVVDPVAMLNEIERVGKPEGKVIITDLRRSWLGIVEKKLKTALTIEEGVEIIKKSKLRPGKYIKGLYWWDYLVGI